MLPKKRLFSRRAMTFAPSEPTDNPATEEVDNNNNNVSKRRRPTPPETARSDPPARTQFSSQPLSSLREGQPMGRKQKRVTFNVSEDEEDEIDTTVRQTKSEAFESALNLAKSKPISTPALASLYGGTNKFEAFGAMLKNQKRQAAKDAEIRDINKTVDDAGQVDQLAMAHDDELTSTTTSISRPQAETPKVFKQKMSPDEASEKAFEGREHMAALTPPPQKTLYNNAIEAGSELATMWYSNQINSPLLRLPDNVRQLIYGYALGGNTIEFSYVSYAHFPQLDGTLQTVAFFRYMANVFDDRCNPFVDWAKMPAGIICTRGMSLLNGVSRQLYLETYTIPYALNHFCFNWAHSMYNFIVQEQRLTRQQRQAFTSVTISGDLPVAGLLQKLPNLQRIKIMNHSTPTRDGWWKVVRTADGPQLKKEASSWAQAQSDRWAAQTGLSSYTTY